MLVRFGFRPVAFKNVITSASMVKLSQLARGADLAFDATYTNGQDLFVYPDAAAAIATVVKAKNPCRAVSAPTIAFT
jgi:hypothetical protein